LSVTYDMTVVFSGTPVYTLNKTDRRDIAEILLKVELSTITLTPSPLQGRIRDFKLEGAHLKKLRRAEGGANIFEVFRVKNRDFTPKYHIFFQF